VNVAADGDGAGDKPGKVGIIINVGLTTVAGAEINALGLITGTEGDGTATNIQVIVSSSR